MISGNNIIPQGTNLITRAFINVLPKWIAPLIKYKPCQYDLLVDERFDLNNIGFNAYIMYTPGHTIGSMSVIIDDEVALVGDTMFGVFKRSVFPPFADDVSEMIKSWGKLLNSNCKVFLPSHGNEKSREQLITDYNKKNNKSL